MGGACNTRGREEKYIDVLVGKPEEKRPFGRPRRIWEDNIEVDNKEIRWEAVDWIKLAQDKKQ
jgi:hypothetical protein